MLFVEFNAHLEVHSTWCTFRRKLSIRITTQSDLFFLCFSFKRQEAGELKQNRFERPDFRIGKQSADHDGRGRVFETGNG